jgi:hypothetical protein
MPSSKCVRGQWAKHTYVDAERVGRRYLLRGNITSETQPSKYGEGTSFISSRDQLDSHPGVFERILVTCPKQVHQVFTTSTVTSGFARPAVEAPSASRSFLDELLYWSASLRVTRVMTWQSSELTFFMRDRSAFVHSCLLLKKHRYRSSWHFLWIVVTAIDRSKSSTAYEVLEKGLNLCHRRWAEERLFA